MPGDTIRIYHYGALSPDTDGVTRVHPDRFGAGKHTQGEARAIPHPPRSFFYTHPDDREFHFDAKRRYVADVPASTLYDLTTDPDGITSRLPSHALFAHLKGKGYKGAIYPFDPMHPIVTLWEPQPVTEDTAYTPKPRPLPTKMLFARQQAPAGGMVANNLYAKGGRFVPAPLSRVATVMARLRSRRVALSRPPRSESAPAGNAELQALAAKYRERYGLGHPPMPRLTEWSRPHAEHMAKVFDSLVSDPNHPDVQAAYRAMAREVRQQHDFLREHGYHPEYMHDDPYPNSAAMMHDLGTRKKIKVFKTGEGQTHPMLSDEENDMFRFVHDVFGHGMHGHQFGPKGEDNAYRDHAAMFTPLARRAMATETRGQNSWVNAGPHSHLPVPERPFAQQKAALWPEHLSGEYHEMPAPAPVKLARPATDSFFPFEQERMAKMKQQTRDDMSRMTDRAIGNKKGPLPTNREITALAHLGSPSKGGYADAGTMLHDMLGSVHDVHRWAAINAVLSAQTPWVEHTEGATRALAMWHKLGRPQDTPTLQRLFDHAHGAYVTGRLFGPTDAKTEGYNPMVRGTWKDDDKPARKKAPARLAPSFYDAVKARKLVTILSRPDFLIDPDEISATKFKTPNFALAHVDHRGVPIDTHMAKLLHVPGRMSAKVLLQAQKDLIDSPAVTMAYKSLIEHSARELGWEPRQVQEAVWVGVLSLMLAKNHGATSVDHVVDLLHQRAQRAGWDMHTVFESPLMVRSLGALGAEGDKFTAAVRDSRARHPVAGAVPPLITDPAAIQGALDRVPADTPAAAKPIARALHLSRSTPRRSSSFDALLHLALLAAYGA